MQGPANKEKIMIDPELKKEFKKTRNKQNTQFVFILVFLTLIFCYMAIIPATAQTITMSNPQGITERDIIVYWPNGTMQGYYNSTSVITLESTSDYIFTMKPMSANPLEDPATWLTENAFPFVETNIIGIVIIIILAALWARSLK